MKSIHTLFRAQLPLLAAVVMASYGCAEPQKQQKPGEGDTPVALTASIVSETAETWNQGDAVGLFMLRSGGTLPDDLLAGMNNTRYEIADPEQGTLTSTETIYYPLDVERVDLVAYAPYNASQTGGTCEVNVSNQTTPQAIDLLYARTTDVAPAEAPVALAFSHQLSRITLDLKAGSGMTSDAIAALTAADVTIAGMPVTATLTLADGTLTAGSADAGTFSPVKNGTASEGADASFSAIVIPQAQAAGSVTFRIGSQETVWNIPGDVAFEAGKHTAFPITINADGTLTLGTPVISDWTTNDHPGQSLEMSFTTVRIPAGMFVMGSPADEAGHVASETQHEVTLTRAFFCTSYEITNAEYAAFLNNAGVDEEGRLATGAYPDQTLVAPHDRGVQWSAAAGWQPAAGFEEYPVINVSWYGADEFARWAGGELPTDAQWEYACRAGNKNAYSFGADFEANGGKNYTWYAGNATETQPVGAKKSNAYLLYDMHGNVREWCRDSWNGAGYDSEAAVTDPESPYAGDEQIVRGGSWKSDAAACRSACREAVAPATLSDDLGFRIIFPL